MHWSVADCIQEFFAYYPGFEPFKVNEHGGDILPRMVRTNLTQSLSTKVTFR